VVRTFPAPASGQGGKWLVSTNGATSVRWSRNSRELLYQEGDRIMAVSYTLNGDSFVADKPRVRLEKLGGTIWDLAPDGRIAVLTPVESAHDSQQPNTRRVFWKTSSTICASAFQLVIAWRFQKATNSEAANLARIAPAFARSKNSRKRVPAH